MKLEPGQVYEVTVDHTFKGRLVRTEVRPGARRGTEVEVAIFATDDGSEHKGGNGLRTLPVNAIRAQAV